SCTARKVTLPTGSVPAPVTVCGGHRLSVAQTCHSPRVTGWTLSAKGGIDIGVCGPSDALRPASRSGVPIVKRPPGITIISGQSEQSRNRVPAGVAAVIAARDAATTAPAGGGAGAGASAGAGVGADVGARAGSGAGASRTPSPAGAPSFA